MPPKASHGKKGPSKRPPPLPQPQDYKTQPCPSCGMRLTESMKTLYHSGKECRDYKLEKAREAASNAKKN